MPIPQRVQYPADIEPLVQFIEETSPEEVLDRTLEKLRAGVPTDTMLTASALAVTRSTDMPPGHQRQDALREIGRLRSRMHALLRAAAEFNESKSKQNSSSSGSGTK